MTDYKKTVLPNGVRVVTEGMPHLKSASIGIWVDIGSRDEANSENGICHFIEHMLFKGTESRTALEIASALESLGGNLNAFTSREQTCFYARVIDEHLPAAVNILTDMLMNSTLAAPHVEKERNVIIDEINDVLDTPSDHVHDLFSRAIWTDHTLGNPIMGTTELISAMTRNELAEFMKTKYTSGRIVVAAAGHVDHDRLVEMLQEKLLLETENPLAAIQTEYSGETPKRTVSSRESNQTHICLGFPGYRYAHPNKFATLVLHSILGAGMSSRLFQAVREELGFAYSVYTYQDYYRDCGTFCVCLSTDDKKVVQSTDVILTEIARIRDENVSQSELESAQQQLKGNLVLGLEGSSSRMNRLARHELGYNRYESLEDTLSNIEKVTLDDLNEAAVSIFQVDRCAAAFLGPVKESVLDEIAWKNLSS
ncbi:MAG: pitrilysin family protein [Candidatus Zixiibacteriota bacterium]